MKKLLIICLVLLTGYTNANVKVNKIEHQDIFDQIQLSDYQNVMIVAHPDDETIWGGMHLLKDKCLVVCLTNGDNEIRSKEFKEVIKKGQNKFCPRGDESLQMIITFFCFIIYLVIYND